MNPVAFDLPPTRRVLAPGVAYAAGLVCEHRPQFADVVRAAMFGPDPYESLCSAAREAAVAKRGEDCHVLAKLADVYHYAGIKSGNMQALVSMLGIMPRLPPSCVWYEHIDGRWRYGHPDNVFIELEGFTPSKSTPPLGAVWAHPLGPGVIGIPHEVTSHWRGRIGADKARQTAAVWRALVSEGFAAAWAKAHLDALA